MNMHPNKIHSILTGIEELEGQEEPWYHTVLACPAFNRELHSRYCSSPAASQNFAIHF